MASGPRIAISTTTGQELSGPLPGLPRTNVSTDYVDAVLAAGGVPVMLPLFDPERYPIVDDQLEGVDALVLTGGQDIDPSRYGQERRPECGESLPVRDAYDLRLLEAARSRGIPVLAICRGFQLVNVAGGGTLVQDLPTDRPSEVAHWQSGAPDQPTHTVSVTPGGLLAQAVGEVDLAVVSYHHQGVDQLGRGLVVEATAPDGLVEAVRAEQGWLLAVQWHPEMSHRHDRRGLALFELLVSAASG